MSQISAPRGATPVPHRAVFAGVLLMIAGVVNILQGITAINNGGLQSNTSLNNSGLQNGVGSLNAWLQSFFGK